MSRRLLSIMACLCLGLCGCAGVSRNDQGITAVGVRVHDATSPHELAEVYAVFREATAEQLRKLAARPECDIALPAAWELVRRTVPKGRYDDAIVPDKEAISWFLALVAKHTEVRMPWVWAAAIKSSRSYGRQNIWFPVAEVVTASQPSWNDRDGDDLDSVSFGQVGKQWVVKTSSHRWLVPLDPDTADLIQGVSVNLTTATAFVVLHGSPPFQYPLYAIDRDSGTVRWSAKVWTDVAIGASGPDIGTVELRRCGRTLFVFGVYGQAAYIEAFDTKTGCPLCRFGTGFFRTPDGD